jgi:hypothetical protein
VSLPAPPNAMGPPRDEGYSVPRRNIRPGQAASPVVRRLRLSAAWVTRGRFPGISARLDGIIWPSARAVSSVAFVAPRSGNGAIAGQRVPPRQQMRAALQLLFGPAKRQEVKHCLTTPGAYGIFEC